ncbi:hypothetical protein EDB81DRAFT_753290 [Dactylonectria macrodidyma]|uniref:Major facilitator superfamily (MFS) profile domain-containing protein n=1 Tax=Dactylonectria macrodidyma TaxID=307937 RepID=A0A9P9JHJ3_9HYPO|nr:hypothetical protein EDB81DRAFT_753290 [Dactylonectria macrodidyma]
MEKLPEITNTCFVALVATVGGMLFGFDISSMAAIVTTEQYIHYFDNSSGVKQGTIGSALAAGSVVGSLIAGPISDKWGRRDRYFTSYGCGYIMGTASFRTAWGTLFIPCVFLMVGLPFLPRSPGWLAKNGMWKRTLAGLSVQAWQQMSGANVMVYYMHYVFQMANLTGKINLITAGVQYALFIIFTTVMFFFIDKTGRCSLLGWGAVGMSLRRFVVGGMLESYGVDVPGGVEGNANVAIRVTGSPAHTVIAFSYLLIIIYALTLAPVAWKTKKGSSRLEAEVAAAQEAKDKGKLDLLERELPGHLEKS